MAALALLLSAALLSDFLARELFAAELFRELLQPSGTLLALVLGLRLASRLRRNRNGLRRLRSGLSLRWFRLGLLLLAYGHRALW